MLPDNPIGVVLFAHGSGSNKGSARNQLVSEILNNNNIATLLFDLLTDDERTFDLRLENMSYKVPGAVLNKFNVSLLVSRLSTATEWILRNSHTEKLPVGYFASSTGGAAALIAACNYKINSIVVRSGRADLVKDRFLDQIVSPCLFIAGSKEKSLVKITSKILKKMRNSGEKQLKIIKGASHLLEEEGSVQAVAEVATQWLIQHFTLRVNTRA